MNTNINFLDFNISEKDFLRLTSFEKLANLLPMDCVDIWYYNNNQPLYLLHSFWVEDALRVLIAQLSQVLNNNLQLHSSINKDIGYLWNEQVQHRIEIVRDDQVEGCPWIGMRFLLFSPPEGTMTWIYNNTEGKIILEITPSYLWNFREPEEGENFIKYDDFILNYKPLLITEICKGTALEWLNKANQLLAVISDNE